MSGWCRSRLRDSQARASALTDWPLRAVAMEMTV